MGRRFGDMDCSPSSWGSISRDGEGPDTVGPGTVGVGTIDIGFGDETWGTTSGRRFVEIGCEETGLIC